MLLLLMIPQLNGWDEVFATFKRDFCYWFQRRLDSIHISCADCLASSHLSQCL